LYGHKLPVLAVDISADSRLIVTGSSDRTVKIWGLDFGDCHKTLLGHADSVMAIKFLPPSTHHVMSAGRDGKIKYWDADKHVLVTTMKV
jgi:U3 small nucleolar RNA-associated protein 12